MKCSQNFQECHSKLQKKLLISSMDEEMLNLEVENKHSSYKPILYDPSYPCYKDPHCFKDGDSVMLGMDKQSLQGVGLEQLIYMSR